MLRSVPTVIPAKAGIQRGGEPGHLHGAAANTPEPLYLPKPAT